MAASSCLSEIALAAGGEWRPYRLEKHINRATYVSQQGRYGRLERGIVPTNGTAYELKETLGEKCDVKYWRDHSIWELLRVGPIAQVQIDKALSSVRSNIKRYIWLDPPPLRNKLSQPIRLDISIDNIECIGKRHTLDSLITLFAFSREARSRGMLRQAYWAARESLGVFPYVMGKYPQLYICWKSIAQRAKKVIWQPEHSYTMEATLNVSLSDLELKIDAVKQESEKKGISFPPPDIVSRHNRFLD